MELAASPIEPGASSNVPETPSTARGMPSDEPGMSSTRAGQSGNVPGPPSPMAGCSARSLDTPGNSLGAPGSIGGASSSGPGGRAEWLERRDRFLGAAATHAAHRLARNTSNLAARRSRLGWSVVLRGSRIIRLSNCFNASSIGPSCCPNRRSETCRRKSGSMRRPPDFE